MTGPSARNHVAGPSDRATLAPVRTTTEAALREELDARNASPLSLYESAGFGRSETVQGKGEGTPEDSTHRRTHEGAGPDPALLGHGSQVFTGAVTATLAELPPHDFEHAVRLLSDRKRRITLAGGRFTHLLAQYLGLHLMQLRDDVRFLPDHDVERTAVLAALTRCDVLVVFDYRRYESDRTTMAALVQEQGGKVVLFADTWLAPGTPQAEVVLPSRVTAPSPYDSLVADLAVCRPPWRESSRRWATRPGSACSTARTPHGGQGSTDTPRTTRRFCSSSAVRVPPHLPERPPRGPRPTYDHGRPPPPPLPYVPALLRTEFRATDRLDRQIVQTIGERTRVRTSCSCIRSGSRHRAATSLRPRRAETDALCRK
ncbi:MurR/RpiR family transcriptional regulator [Streptomyces sp. NPDC091287]|uniref:MurR/RpiR family transcriptional regulator n=1 Tax=Streptomyces sp. NPDC091287 TaxID=3365988 RepID=UPI0038041749